MNPGDHHVINECYLPEVRQWAVTDLTNNQLLIQKSNNDGYPNLLSIRDSSAQNLRSLQATDSSIANHLFEATLYNKYFGNKIPSTITTARTIQKCTGQGRKSNVIFYLKHGMKK